MNSVARCSSCSLRRTETAVPFGVAGPVRPPASALLPPPLIPSIAAAAELSARKRPARYATASATGAATLSAITTPNSGIPNTGSSDVTTWPFFFFLSFSIRVFLT